MRRTGGLDELTASKRNLLVSKIVAEFQQIYEGNVAELEDEVGRLESEVFNSAINVEQYFALMGSKSTSLKAQLINSSVHTMTAEWEPNETAGSSSPRTATAAVDRGAFNTAYGVRSLQAILGAEGGATTEDMASWLKSARRSRATTEFGEGAAGDSAGLLGGGVAGGTEDLPEGTEAGGRSPADQAGSDSAEGSCTAPALVEPQKPLGGTTPTFGGGDLATAITSRRQRLAQHLPRLHVPSLIADPDLYQSPIPHGYEAQYDASHYTGAYGLAPGTVPSSGQNSPHQGFGMSLARLGGSGELPQISGVAGRSSLMPIFQDELGVGGARPPCNEVPQPRPSAQPFSEGRSDFGLRPMLAQPPQEVIFTRCSGPPRMCLSPGSNDPTPAQHFTRAPTNSDALNSMSAPAAPSRIAVQPRAAVPNPPLAYPASTPDIEPLYKEPPAIYRSSSTPGSSASWLASNAAFLGSLAPGRTEAVDTIRQHLAGGGDGEGGGGGYADNAAGLCGAQACAPSSFMPTGFQMQQQQQLQQEPWLMAPGIAAPLQPPALNDSHQQQAGGHTDGLLGAQESQMAAPPWLQAPAPGMEMRCSALTGMQMPSQAFAQPSQQQLQRRPSMAGMPGPSGSHAGVPRATSSTALQQSRPAPLPPLAPRQESSWQAAQQPPPWNTQEQMWHQSGGQAVAPGRQAKSPRSSMQKRSPLGSAGPLQPSPWETCSNGGGAGPSGSAPPSVMGQSSGAAATSIVGSYGQYDNLEQLVAQQAQEAAAAAASVAAAAAATDARSNDFPMHNATATGSTNDDAACAPTAGPSRPSPAFLRTSWTSGYPQLPSVRAPTPSSLSVPASIRASSWSGDASAAAAVAAAGMSVGGVGVHGGSALQQPPPPPPTDRHDMLAFPRQYPHQRPSQPPHNFYQPQPQDPETMELVQQQLLLLQQHDARQATGQDAQPPAWSRQPPPPLRTVSGDWCGSLSVTASPSPYNSSSSPSPYRSQAHSSLIAASSSSLGMNGLSLGLSTGCTTSGSDVWEAAQARGGAAGGGGGSATGGNFWGLGGAIGSRQADQANAVPNSEPPLLVPIDTASDPPGMGPLFTAYPVSPVWRKQELASPSSAAFGHHIPDGRQRTSMAGIFGRQDAGVGSSWVPDTGRGRASGHGNSTGQNALNSQVADTGAGGGQEGAAAGGNDHECFTLERDVSLSRGMAAGPEGAGSGGGVEAGQCSNGGNVEAYDNVFGLGLHPLPDAMPDIAAMLN